MIIFFSVSSFRYTYGLIFLEALIITSIVSIENVLTFMNGFLNYSNYVCMALFLFNHAHLNGI